MYRKKGEEGEHYLLSGSRNRAADLSAVVVIDGEQRRTPTARNCNDVRPRRLLGAIDLHDETYAGPGLIQDCSLVYFGAPATRPVVSCKMPCHAPCYSQLMKKKHGQTMMKLRLLGGRLPSV